MPPIMIGAGIIVFLLIAAGVRLLFSKKPARLTAFAGEAGNVLVSRKAIQELIKQTCLMDERVEAVRPKVRFADSKVHTYVELRLTSSENLKESSARVQSRITELLKKSLNFDQIGDIQIVVTSFGNDIGIPTSTENPASSKALESTTVLATEVPQLVDKNQEEESISGEKTIEEEDSKG